MVGVLDAGHLQTAAGELLQELADQRGLAGIFPADDVNTRWAGHGGAEQGRTKHC